MEAVIKLLFETKDWNEATKDELNRFFSLLEAMK